MGKKPKNRKNNPGRPTPKPAAKPTPVVASPVAAAAASTMTLEPPRPSSRIVAPPSHAGEGHEGGLGPVAAVFRRNYFSYFSNPAGYVFITLFVVVCAAAAFWQPIFFANNLANLAPLDEWMPYLLLFFIPAITMNAWAEERRLGTDELLLTLPARDAEIVLGKYLAALGIYTTALVFSLSLVAILYWVGTPDFGVLVATYLGYWLMGVLLVAIGLVASVLSSNVTVAFILGAVFSAIPVLAGLFASPFGLETRRAIEDLSIPNQFRDFGTGVVPLSGVFYFVGLAAAMLYLNMVLLGRRHWAGGERAVGLTAQSTIRVISVLVALGAADILIARWVAARPDLSSEGLHRLSPESLKLIGEIPSDKPVYIEAYYSDEVPRDYVQTKADLLNKLREFASASRGTIRLNLVPTALYSDDARDAEKRYGIQPRRVSNEDQARQTSEEIFLGVSFTSGAEEVVVPFFDRGLPVEYELTRSIRVVSKLARKTLGVLQTDAKLLGGFDFKTMGQDNEWQFVTELKKQYEVRPIPADTPIPGDLDVLLVAQPSSLNQRQADNLAGYIKTGKPTLLLVDPLTRFDPSLSPELPKPQPGGPFGGGQPPEPKADLTPLWELMGVDWPNNEVVWNPYNPFTRFEIPPEFVIVARSGNGDEAFNATQSATSGLQELMTLFPGELRSRGGGPDFIPLLRTGDDGGTVLFSDLVQSGPFGGMSFAPNPRHRPSGVGYTLAARVTGKPAVAKGKVEAKEKAEPAGAAINAIVVADLDMVSDLFFNFRRQKAMDDIEFDNVTFVLNCVDVLAGDESYVDLRKRRIRHRTLSRLEDQTREFALGMQRETKSAEDAATDQLAAAQKRLNEKVTEVEKRTDLDEQNKQIMMANLQEVENRRFGVDKINIEDAKRVKLAESKAELERKVREIQTGVRMRAILLPPLPAFLLGAVVFAVRLGRENRGANPNRIA